MADAGPVLETMPARIRDIAVMRGCGYSLVQIARYFGVTPQAVSIMLVRHRRRIAELGTCSEHLQLSTRASNVLGRLGIETREQALACDDLFGLIRGQRNCGRKTVAEIGRWLDGDAGRSTSGEAPSRVTKM